MKQSYLYCLLTAALVLIPFSAAHAGELSVPNTFQAGATAVASEVNANFTAVETAVDDNNIRIAELEALVATLMDRIEELEASNVMALAPYVSVDEDSDDRGALVRISGANFQIVNGLGSTDTYNALGNLIVGYDEVNDGGICTDSSYTDQDTCENAGEVWIDSSKTGSHYLVLGSQNSYSQYGGLVAGRQNFSTGAYSSIGGGKRNVASGDTSSVGGGADNTASGSVSGVSGGEYNNASGESSSVSGGANRSATAQEDWAAGDLYEDD